MTQPEPTPEQQTEARELLARAVKSQEPFLDDLRKLERLLGITIEARTNLRAVALRELILARDFGAYNDEISRLPAFWDEG